MIVKKFELRTANKRGQVNMFLLLVLISCGDNDYSGRGGSKTRLAESETHLGFCSSTARKSVSMSVFPCSLFVNSCSVIN